MSVIVDSSVALKWFIIEQDHEVAKRLIGDALLAPDLVVAEVSNALWKKVRRKEMAREQALLAQSLLTSFVDIVPSPPLAEAALQIAMELDHPAYDCFFLALSKETGLKLITSDARLLGRCAGTPFESLLEPLA